jgi:3-hydroxymyristoyl/3-hydroxydecanoyl-(acyl carrier protein) dehydratase
MRVPPVQTREEDGERLRLRLAVGPDLDCFRGHFPGMPVLPGVVQLDWAIAAARDYFGLDASPMDIRRLKFKSVLTPPAEVDLVLAKTGPTTVQFSFSAGDVAYSEGRLHFPENLVGRLVNNVTLSGRDR